MLLNVNLAPAVSGTTHKKRGKKNYCPKEFMVECKDYFHERVQCWRFWKTVAGGQYVSQSFITKANYIYVKWKLQLAECTKRKPWRYGSFILLKGSDSF